jgi:hypothetical protein
MFVDNIPEEEKKDWYENQEYHKLNQEKKIQEAQEKLAKIDQLISETNDPEQLAKLKDERNWIDIPEPYVIEHPPLWMQMRGVKSRNETVNLTSQPNEKQLTTIDDLLLAVQEQQTQIQQLKQELQELKNK